MAGRYTRTRILKYISEAVNALPMDYFITADVMVKLRESSLRRDMPLEREVSGFLRSHGVAEQTKTTVRRRNGHGGKSEYALFKKVGAPEPPDDWEYDGGVMTS